MDFSLTLHRSTQESVVHGKRSYQVDSTAKRLEEYVAGLDETLAVHRPPFPANVLAWVGGAVFGALEVVATRSVTREQYARAPNLPDWTSIATAAGTPPADSPECRNYHGTPVCIPLPWRPVQPSAC